MRDPTEQVIHVAAHDDSVVQAGVQETETSDQPGRDSIDMPGSLPGSC
jgi:hypothetical protein